METLITVLFAISVNILIAVMWYKIGYDRREKIFQQNPISFTHGKQTVVICSIKYNGIVEIKVIDDKLVEIVK